MEPSRRTFLTSLAAAAALHATACMPALAVDREALWYASHCAGCGFPWPPECVNEPRRGPDGKPPYGWCIVCVEYFYPYIDPVPDDWM